MKRDDDRESLTSAEIEEATRHVARHLGPTPNWIAQLLVGKHVGTSREQDAYYAAWKARFGVTEREAPAKKARP